jgi:hypothetical protein
LYDEVILTPRADIDFGELIMDSQHSEISKMRVEYLMRPKNLVEVRTPPLEEMDPRRITRKKI